MVALNPPEVDRSFTAPDFSLPGIDGRKYALDDVMGQKGLLVMFICNHCPFVQAILDKITRDARALQQIGIGVVAISANDAEEYPEDSPEKMRDLAQEYNFTFPYLYDETQTVAKTYGAVCTPDFFGFNAEGKLQYRGRLDDSGMQTKAGGQRELFDAMTMVANMGRGPEIQNASIGCSIKWKGGA